MIPAILIVATGMVSCSSSDPTHSALGEQNKALVEKFYQAVSDNDTTALQELLSDDFMKYGPAASDSSTKAGFMDFVKSLHESYGSVSFNRVARISYDAAKDVPGEYITGNWVFIWTVLTLKTKDSGKEVKVNLHEDFAARHGKIEKLYVFLDYADWLKQMGYTFVAPATDSTSMK